MDTANATQPADPSALLKCVAQARILAGLHEAVELAEAGLGDHLEPLRDLLNDLNDRTASLDLMRQLDQQVADAPRTCLLGRSVLTGTEGAPATEFLLIPLGAVSVEHPCAGGDFVFTREHAGSAKRWFDGLGRKLAIDYEHQSFDRFNTRADGLRPAAGWIGGLDVRDDGLWATDVTWTDRARALLRSGEYRYFSPVIFWTDEEHSDVAALGPVALTNDPAMRGVSPLAAARRLDETDVNDEDAGAHEELEAAQAEICLLKRQLAAQEADTFVERGMRLGKVLDSTSIDWRADYLRDAEGTEEKLARAPVLLPPGRVLTLNRRGEVEPLPEAEREYRRHGDLYRRWGVGPEDLAAYARAVAAGRVIEPSTAR